MMVRYVLYLIALVFVVWTVATSLTQVQSHERAVIRRFGRILDHKPEQGLYIGLPWGIDRVELAPVGRVRSITVGFSDKEEKEEDVIPAGQLLTGDHNLVNVQASINYRVRDAGADMENYVLQKDQVDAFVARAAESLVAEWIAARKIDDVLRLGKTGLSEYLRQLLPERLMDYELGIVIESASIPKLDPPAEVKAAFDGLGQAQASIKTKKNQAEEAAAAKKSKVDAEMNKIASEARSYANDRRSSAVADADSFLKRQAQYREFASKDPDYLNALWLDEMTRLYAKMRAEGRIELLDHFLTSEGLTITQFPLQPRKK